MSPAAKRGPPTSGLLPRNWRSTPASHRSADWFSPDRGCTMAKLIYSAFTSLDGYVADENGNFDWAELDEEILAYINNRERQVGTYLFGRKMYETMAVW